MLTTSKNSDSRRSKSRRPGSWLARLAVVLCAALAMPSYAQMRGGKKVRIARSSFSHLVPDTVGLFAELRLTNEIYKSLRDGNFWTLVESLAAQRPGGSSEPFDWRDLLRRNLGMPPEAALAELFGRRMAVAAPSWERLGDAVILVRLKSPKSLDPVIAGKRLAHMEPRGKLHVYRTTTGLWIASNGRVAVFSQDAADDALFWDVIARMNERQPSPLSEHGPFVEQVGRLLRGHMAYLYFAQQPESDGSSGQLVADFRRGVTAMYVHRSNVHFELRAQLDQLRTAHQYLAIDADRLQRLPDSVLAVWAGTLDLPAAYRRLLDGDPSGQADGYLELLAAVFDLEVLEQRIIDKLGQRAIVVWDRARGDSDIPQLCVMFESAEAPEVAVALANELADAAYMRFEDEEPGPVELIEHLDAEIYSVALDTVVSRRQGAAASDLLRALQPSFAALDGWVVAATSPGTIRQIIDADRGWIPRLNSIRGLGLRSVRRPENRVTLAVAQPAMASAVLASWKDQQGDAWPGKLTHMLARLQATAEALRRPTLGVAIKEGERAGSVRVVRVHASWPAEGRLVVGDEIIGVEGSLLALQDPVADLRRRVAQCRNPAHMAMRVRRENRLLDVTVPLQLPDSDKLPAVSPVEALRQFQSLAKLLNCASYTVYRSGADQFHARVSLQLIPKKKSTPGAQ